MPRRRGSSGVKVKMWKSGQRAIPYIRVSDVGDRGDALISPDVQVQQCLNWGQREGVILGEPVIELDMSGRTSDKRQIANLIERVRNGEADGVVVWKFSRWGRSLTDSMLNIREMQDAGGFVASATEGIDEIETPSGKYTLGQMLLLAEYQSDQIGEVWANVHEYRISNGLPASGGERFGYTYDPDAGIAPRGQVPDFSKVYTVDSTTGPWLRKCYEGFVAGRTMSSLVTELYENGIRSNTGGKIIYTTLRQILDSGFGAGLLVDKTGANGATTPDKFEYHPGAHAGVIDMDTWERYLRKRKEKRAPREAAAVHRLTGLLYCGECGRKLAIRWGLQAAPRAWQRANPGVTPSVANGGYIKRRIFECPMGKSGQARVDAGSCPKPSSISQRQIEQRVYEWIVEHTKGTEAEYAAATARKSRATTARADVDRIDAELARLRKRLSNAADMALDARDNDDEETFATFKEKQTEIRGDIKALEENKAKLEVEADVSSIPTEDAFKALANAWTRKGTNLSMLNEALRTMISRVMVYPDTIVPAQRVRIVAGWDEALVPERPAARV